LDEPLLSSAVDVFGVQKESVGFLKVAALFNKVT
jgi:hypothetical protein